MYFLHILALRSKWSPTFISISKNRTKTQFFRDLTKGLFFLLRFEYIHKFYLAGSDC